ncbi:uncharacterized protein LOC123662991 [Melitaea cinxia]|uniref:uncharacterized protein LOC123662991 n=1 Tax=Melitaea cinxia TaxID=113334 RepID=UPI001E2702A8|nr:uncharacterized protein LOC123662991 [Melitaea cinxia]
MSTSIDGNDAIYDDDVIKVAESKTAEPAGIEAEIVFDTSTPHSSLKRPMSSPLKCRAKRRREVLSCNLIKKALQEKKLNVLDELHDMELQKIKQNIEQQKELHEQKLRHNEEKHKLEIIKLHLEIDLLKNK